MPGDQCGTDHRTIVVWHNHRWCPPSRYPYVVYSSNTSTSTPLCLIVTTVPCEFGFLRKNKVSISWAHEGVFQLKLASLLLDHTRKRSREKETNWLTESSLTRAKPRERSNTFIKIKTLSYSFIHRFTHQRPAQPRKIKYSAEILFLLETRNKVNFILTQMMLRGISGSP